MDSLNSELKQEKKNKNKKNPTQIIQLTTLYNELQDKISTQWKHPTWVKTGIENTLEAQEKLQLCKPVARFADHNKIHSNHK